MKIRVSKTKVVGSISVTRTASISVRSQTVIDKLPGSVSMLTNALLYGIMQDEKREEIRISGPSIAS